jgi:hypothetical protein
MVGQWPVAIDGDERSGTMERDVGIGRRDLCASSAKKERKAKKSTSALHPKTEDRQTHFTHSFQS